MGYMNSLDGDDPVLAQGSTVTTQNQKESNGYVTPGENQAPTQGTRTGPYTKTGRPDHPTVLDVALTDSAQLTQGYRMPVNADIGDDTVYGHGSQSSETDGFIGQGYILGAVPGAPATQYEGPAGFPFRMDRVTSIQQPNTTPKNAPVTPRSKRPYPNHGVTA